MRLGGLRRADADLNHTGGDSVCTAALLKRSGAAATTVGGGGTEGSATATAPHKAAVRLLNRGRERDSKCNNPPSLSSKCQTRTGVLALGDAKCFRVEDNTSGSPPEGVIRLRRRLKFT